MFVDAGTIRKVPALTILRLDARKPLPSPRAHLKDASLRMPVRSVKKKRTSKEIAATHGRARGPPEQSCPNSLFRTPFFGGISLRLSMVRALGASIARPIQSAPTERAKVIDLPFDGFDRQMAFGASRLLAYVSAHFVTSLTGRRKCPYR